MLRRWEKTSCMRVVCACICLFFMSGTAFAESQLMRMQCVYPETSFGGMLTKSFAEKVEAYTDGQVKVKLFWPNQLVKVGESYKAVSKGLVQGVAAAGVYFGGIVPEVKVEMMPFAWKSSQDALDLFYKEGVGDLLREAHMEKGVYYAGSVFAGSMLFLTKFPVKSLEDFKGKKVRAMSAYADVVQKIGAVPTTMDNTEQYMGLKTGVIDATVFPADCIEPFKFNEVCDHVVLPGIINPVPMDFFLNNKWFSSLPEELQAKIDKAVLDLAVESAPWSDRRDQGGIDFAKKENMTIETLSDQDVQTLRDMASEGWDEVGAQSPRCQKLVDIVKESLKN